MLFLRGKIHLSFWCDDRFPGELDFPFRGLNHVPFSVSR